MQEVWHGEVWQTASAPISLQSPTSSPNVGTLLLYSAQLHLAQPCIWNSASSLLWARPSPLSILWCFQKHSMLVANPAGKRPGRPAKVAGGVLFHKRPGSSLLWRATRPASLHGSEGL
jgi:hypothetical protein